METVFLGEDGAGGDMAEEKDEEIDPLDAFMMEVQQVSSHLCCSLLCRYWHFYLSHCVAHFDTMYVF